jgi:hypothetical protein
MKRLETGCHRCGVHQSVPTGAIFLSRAAAWPEAWLVCRGCSDLVAIRLPDQAFGPLAAAGCHVVAEPLTATGEGSE